MSTTLSEASPLLRQLEELQLIRCSLLPGEMLVFLEDTETWNRLLDYFTSGSDMISELPNYLSPPHFKIKLDDTAVWFEVEIPTARGDGDRISGNPPPMISVKGEDVSRVEQEAWKRIVKEQLEEMSETEFPTFQLVSLHLLPLLHEKHEEQASESLRSFASIIPAQIPGEQYHALLTSHHLISPNKRRSLQQWSSSLWITGFAKVGYPGVIYAQGIKENVEEFVSNVKAMQWLALRVRFIEPLKDSFSGNNFEGNKWNEFQKVGDVVEEMRRIGREEYVVEMGIGSSGAK